MKAKACPVITVIGNSIAWGVGSDGLSATTDGYSSGYRQHAWPVQLRKRLAMLRGQLPTENFIALDTRAGYAALGGTAVISQTIGPLGGFGVNRGGVSLPDSTATITIDSTKTGRFTDLDVFYWGTTSGVSGGYSPNILIDGVWVCPRDHAALPAGSQAGGVELRGRIVEPQADAEVDQRAPQLDAALTADRAVAAFPRRLVLHRRLARCPVDLPWSGPPARVTHRSAVGAGAHQCPTRDAGQHRERRVGQQGHEVLLGPGDLLVEHGQHLQVGGDHVSRDGMPC